MLLMTRLASASHAVDKKNDEDLYDAELSLLDQESLLAQYDVEVGSRRKQSILESPSTVTVLKAEQIEASANVNIAEMLRRIPGVFVLQTMANEFQVGMRGIARIVNNRVLVQLNGHQANDQMSGLQVWGSLPISPFEIERIEVVRGPGSTIYGANALSGVVNIITKRPLDHQGVQASVRTNLSIMTGTDQNWLAHGSAGHIAYGWANRKKTLGMRLSLGLERTPEWPTGQTPVTESQPYHYQFSGSLQYRPKKHTDLFVNLNYTESQHLLPVEQTGLQGLLFHTRALDLTIDLTCDHFFTDMLSYRFALDGKLWSADLSEYYSNAFEAATLQANYEPKELHTLLFLNLSLFKNRNITTLGVEATLQRVADFFVNPTFSFLGLVLNNETRLLDRSLILVLGGRFEQIDTEEKTIDKIVYRHFSPRAALMLRFWDKHLVRLTAATAFRTPTMLETFTELHLDVLDQSLPPIRLIAPNYQLKPEKLYSLELAYQGVWFDSLRLETVVFGQRIQDLIDDARQISFSTQKTNNQNLWQAGVELGLLFTPNPTFSAYFNYAFTYSHDTDNDTQDQNWPGHLYSFGCEVRLPYHLRANLDAALIFDYKPNLTVRRFDQPGFSLSTFEQRRIGDQALIDIRVGRFFTDDRIEAFMAIKNLVGFFRSPDGLRMLPFSTIQPIGGMIMLGINIRGL